MSKYVKPILDAYIYLYHLDKFCILPSLPENITDSMSTTFNTVNALARTAPVFTYSNSGPRQVIIGLSLHRDMMNEVNTNVSNLKDNVVDFSGDDYVDTLVKYLQAAAVPKYKNFSSGAKSIIPPMVAIRLSNDTFIKGVITSGITKTSKKPILANGKYACVDISFTVSEVDPYDADTIVASGSFRGINKTFKDGIFDSTSSANSFDEYYDRIARDDDRATRESLSRYGVNLTKKKQKEIL